MHGPCPLPWGPGRPAPMTTQSTEETEVAASLDKVRRGDPDDAWRHAAVPLPEGTAEHGLRMPPMRRTRADIWLSVSVAMRAISGSGHVSGSGTKHAT